MARAFLIITVLLLSVSCDREHENCFEAELPKARETRVCNDLWQVCEKKARVTAEEACAAFKPTKAVMLARLAPYGPH
tara:strand:- start:434 stop:667 length:234 start_codon:yes stop_codon:yes gene_type:complete